MSLKIKDLIVISKGLNPEAKVVNHEGQDFIHSVNMSNGDLLISTKKPIAYCKRSSGYIYPTEVEDYLGVSPELDENVDKWEVTLPKLDEEEFPNKFGKAEEVISKYKVPFYLLLAKFENEISDELWEQLHKFDLDLEKE